MPIEAIKSKKNETVKELIKLQSSAGFRRETGLFAMEGARLCCDAAQSGVEIEKVFYTEKAADKYRDYLSPILECAKKAYVVEPFVADAMSAVESTQGIFCIGRMLPDFPLEAFQKGEKYLAAENLQDPSNLGAMLRTAEAVGIKALLLSDNSCDLYAPKVLRASMGAVFRFPVCRAENFAETLSKMTASGFHTYGAVASGEAIAATVPNYNEGAIVVIGNEGNGLTEECKKACEKRITIPMEGRAESLNAAAAAAILIWEMMRKG